MLPFEEIKNLAGESGLKTSQVAEFRQKFGVNEMTPPVRESLWKQYLKNFDDPIIKILLLAVTISTIVSLSREAGFWIPSGSLLQSCSQQESHFSTNTGAAGNSTSSTHTGMIWQ